MKMEAKKNVGAYETPAVDFIFVDAHEDVVCNLSVQSMANGISTADYDIDNFSKKS